LGRDVSSVAVATAPRRGVSVAAGAIRAAMPAQSVVQVGSALRRRAPLTI